MIVRAAIDDDAARLAAIELEAWPEGLAASASDFLARINAYSDGQLVVEHDRQVVAVCSAQRIASDTFENFGSTYDSITDCGRFTATHDSQGEIYQLVGVAVARQFQGLNLGRRLVDAHIEQARAMSGIERILGFTRPVAFHKSDTQDIEQYISNRDESGSPRDPVLAFHVDAGATVVSVHPDFRPDDFQSRGYGVLIEYPIVAQNEAT